MLIWDIAYLWLVTDDYEMKRQRFWESVSCILYFWGIYPVPFIILVLLFSSFQSWLKLGLKLHSTYVFLCAKSLQSCLIHCDPMDCSLPGSSALGILQTRMLEWVAFSSSRGSSQPRDRTHVSCISCSGRQILYHWATWEARPFSLTFVITDPDLFTTAVEGMSYTPERYAGL